MLLDYKEEIWMSIQNYHNKKKAFSIFLASILYFPISLCAQTEEIPRLTNGKPDMQGTWDFRTITPFQRPEALGDKEYLTAEEFAAFEEERESVEIEIILPTLQPQATIINSGMTEARSY